VWPVRRDDVDMSRRTYCDCRFIYPLGGQPMRRVQGASCDVPSHTAAGQLGALLADVAGRAPAPEGPAADVDARDRPVATTGAAETLRRLGGTVGIV
jgi:hypothetical protein